jgi:type VI secretion system VasD/TssJ family lipoprotein
MFTESIARRGLRGGTAVALALSCAVLTGCSSLPFVGGKPSIKLTLEAAPLVNSCGRSSGLPLTVRVLQVSDASALSGATLDHLWDREEKVLGSALLSHADVVVDPGTRKETSIDRVAQAKTAVVVGNFCKAEGTCWYLIKPLKGKSTTIKLALDPACLHETKH